MRDENDVTEEEVRLVVEEFRGDDFWPFAPVSALCREVVRLRRQVARDTSEMEAWLLMVEKELNHYDDAWDDLMHSRDASARATNWSDLSERRSILLDTIREIAELFSSPEATP